MSGELNVIELNFRQEKISNKKNVKLIRVLILFLCRYIRNVQRGYW